MALNETLNLDLSKASRATTKLGRDLDRIIRDRQISLSVKAPQLDGILGDFKRDAEEAARAISRISDAGVDFDKTVAESAKAKTALRNLTDEQERNERQTDNLRDSWRRLALTAAGLFGTREIVRFFKAAATAASDNNESINAVEKVYDDAAGSIERFVETADQLGFSAIQARNAAVQFGGLFQAFDFPQEQAAEFSNRLTKISADLSSIYNRDPDDAARALFGVFRGEPEPARVFGLSITQALVDAKALELGLVATKSEIDQNVKALATFALIEEQAANTTNDFADTLATSLPNQLRVLQAEFANTSARIGEQFREPLLDAIKLIRAEIVPELERSIGQVDLGKIIGDALPPLVDLVQLLIEALPAVIEVAAALGGVFTNLVGLGAQLVGVLGETGTSVAAVLLTANKAEATFGQFGSSAVLAADGLVRITKDGADAKDVLIGIGEQALAGALAFESGWGAVAGVGIGAAALAIGQYQERQREATERQVAFTEAVQEANPEVVSLDEKIRFLSDSYRDVSGAADDAAGSVEDTSLGLIALQSTTATLSEETQQVVEKYGEAAGDFKEFAAIIETGTDIFDDKQGGFIFDARKLGIDTAIENLEELRAASTNAIDNAAIDAFLLFGEANGNNADIMIRLADAIDESADAFDDDTKALEANAEARLRFAVLAGDIPEFVLDMAVALDKSSDSATVFGDAIDAAYRREAEFQALTQEIPQDLREMEEAGRASSLGLQASLGDLAAVDVQIAIDFDQLEEDLSGSFATELEGRIREIEDQLTVKVKIDEEDNVNNIVEVLDEAERVKDLFIARQAAAAKLDLLNLDDLAARVAAGELDGIIEQVLEGNEADIQLLTQANDALVAVGQLQQAAALEQANLFKVEYAEALLTGAADPFKAWIDGVELTPEDFVKFGEEMSGLLSGSLTNQEILDDRVAEGQGIASNFLQGIEMELRETEEMESLAKEAAARMAQAMRNELGIRSPSLVGIDIGKFFDEGLAEGLLEAGYTEEAAQELAGKILAIRGTLSSGLQGGLVPDLEDEEGQVDNYTDVLGNIRAATNEAAQGIADLQKAEQDRAAALDRLDQFGQFDQLSAAVESGAADALLNDIIFAPNAAAFGQIERELQAAADQFNVDPFGLINNSEVAEQGKLYGLEWSFAATEAQKKGLAEGGGAVNALLREQTETNLRELNDAWEDPIVAEIDATASTAELEQTTLVIPAELDFGDQVPEFVGDVPGFDKGGVAYDTMFAIAERGNPEMIAGPHHRGSDIWGWMQELGLDAKMEPFYRERFHQSGLRAPAGSSDGFDAVVSELRSVRSELAAVRASSATAAEHTARLRDISDSTDLSARMALRQHPVSPTLGRDGWKDAYA